MTWNCEKVIDLHIIAFVYEVIKKGIKLIMNKNKLKFISWSINSENL